jgi:hypothetical protein
LCLDKYLLVLRLWGRTTWWARYGLVCRLLLVLVG